MMKLSLEERRRRRKAEQQRKLMEESQRVEQEYRAEYIIEQSTAASSQSQEEEEQQEKPPKKKKKKTKSNLYHSNSQNNNNNSKSSDDDDDDDRWDWTTTSSCRKPAATTTAVCKKNKSTSRSAAAGAASKKGVLDERGISKDSSSVVQKKKKLCSSSSSSSGGLSSGRSNKSASSSPLSKVSVLAAGGGSFNKKNKAPKTTERDSGGPSSRHRRRYDSSDDSSSSPTTKKKEQQPPSKKRSRSHATSSINKTSSSAQHDDDISENPEVVANEVAQKKTKNKNQQWSPMIDTTLLDTTFTDNDDQQQQRDNTKQPLTSSSLDLGGPAAAAAADTIEPTTKLNIHHGAGKQQSPVAASRRRRPRSYSDSSSSSDDSILADNLAIFQQLQAAAAASQSASQHSTKDAAESQSMSENSTKDAVTVDKQSPSIAENSASSLVVAAAGTGNAVQGDDEDANSKENDTAAQGVTQVKSPSSTTMKPQSSLLATPATDSVREKAEESEESSPRSTLRDPSVGASPSFLDLAMPSKTTTCNNEKDQQQLDKKNDRGDEGSSKNDGSDDDDRKVAAKEPTSISKARTTPWKKKTSAFLRPRCYSDSSSDDDSLPNNLAIFQQMQQRAAAASTGISAADATANGTDTAAADRQSEHAAPSVDIASSAGDKNSQNIVPAGREADKSLLTVQSPLFTSPERKWTPPSTVHNSMTASTLDYDGQVDDDDVKQAAGEGPKRLEGNKWGNAMRRTRSYSDSSDDSTLPNNLALFQQMQAAAATAPDLGKDEDRDFGSAQIDSMVPEPQLHEDKQATSTIDATSMETQVDQEKIAALLDNTPTPAAKAPPTSETPTSNQSTPRNPLARMREEARQQLSTRTLAPAFNEDYARQLDEDDDDDDLPVERDDSSSPSSSQKSKEKKPKKKRKAATKSSSSWSATTITVDALEGTQGRDEDELAKELKPQFRENQVLFEPEAMEPIVLEAETDDGDRKEYKVPASISRYLYGFQKDGIRFIFNAIMSEHRGAILGDDMGLGKTIQTIGLLAALLGKTGTGVDLLELHRRARMDAFFKKEAEDAKQEALRSGELYVPDSQQNPGMSAPQEWGPVLILAPSSVLESWIKSFQVWGHFSVALYQNKDRRAILDSLNRGSVEILVASHTRIQSESHVSFLCEIPWKLIIIDEFHKMKNVKSCMAKNLRFLRDKHAESVLIGLTGTCMQNDHKELWNLFDIISKDFLGDWDDFQEMISKPIMLSRTKDANPAAILLGNQRGEELSARLYEIYLMRTKEVVLRDKLPEKDERIVFCELSPLQKKIYKYILEQPDFILLKQYYTPCDCGVNQQFFQELQQLSSREERIEYQRRKKKEIWTKAACCYKIPETYRGSGDIDPRAVLWRRQHEDEQACRKCPSCICLPAMTILSKLSSHVGLIQPKCHPDACAPNSAEHKDATKKLEQAEVFIPKEVINHELPSYVLEDSVMDDHFSLSGKMAVLARLLRAIDARGGRVLIFSAYTQALDLIQNYVTTSGYSFLRMDGGTPTHKRQDLADEFNTSPGILVFLLSTKAMGLGINLTSANFVIIFDVEWNPSWDSQAQDRSYRLGQQRDVTVFRLVSRGTLEEQKYLRQVYKTQLKNETMVDVDDPERGKAARLFRGVANDKSRRGELFGLSNLLRYEDGTLMKYGAEAKEARHFGGGIYNMEAVIEAAKKTLPDDEGFEDISGDHIGVADLAKRSEKDDEDKGGNESDSEDSMIGAESQFVVDFHDAEAFTANNATTGQDGPVADTVPSLDPVADTVPSLDPVENTVPSLSEKKSSPSL